jgi:hypothetical protein
MGYRAWDNKLFSFPFKTALRGRKFRFAGIIRLVKSFFLVILTIGPNSSECVMETVQTSALGDGYTFALGENRPEGSPLPRDLSEL